MLSVIRKRARHPLLGVRATAMGLGLVARRPIKAGAALGRIRGEIIHDPDYSSDYAIGVADGVAIEPEAPYRYLNHSCSPNAEIVVYNEDPAQVFLEAIAPITKGAAVLIDYAWPAEDAIPCLCGTAACRGWIVDPDERHLLPEPSPADGALPAGATMGSGSLSA